MNTYIWLASRMNPKCFSTFTFNMLLRSTIYIRYMFSLSFVLFIPCFNELVSLSSTIKNKIDNSFPNQINLFPDCIDGFYNRNCSGRCGSCVNDGVCDKISGHCTNGCQANYLQSLCQGIWIHIIYSLVWYS